ncbi:MAG TPA: CAP domain-containing protein [Acidimicrobiales bacterium]|nr:CAP domain-containing protein [Acidimicrobiales bacterium]
MRRTLLAAILTLAGVLLPLAPGARAGAATASPAAMENDFVSRINALRASKGLGALQVDAELTGIARNWSAKMAQAGTISHNPNFANEVRANWVKLGENVGVGPDVPSLFQAFVNSPHHYENLVDPAFTRVGVGVVVTSKGTVYTAHQFERLASDGGAAAPAPAAAPAVATPAAVPPAAPAAPVAPPDPVVTPAPAPAPVMPARVALSLEQLRGQAPGL